MMIINFVFFYTDQSTQLTQLLPFSLIVFHIFQTFFTYFSLNRQIAFFFYETIFAGQAKIKTGLSRFLAT